MAAFVIWQRETVYFILHPDKIQVKPAGEIRLALHSGDYGAISGRESPLKYWVLDNAVEVVLTLDQTLLRLDAKFNAYRIPVGGVSDALGKARFILSPYLSPPELNALGLLICMELPGRVTSSGIEYSRDIGSHTVFVAGSMDTGDMLVTVTLLGETP